MKTKDILPWMSKLTRLLYEVVFFLLSKIIRLSFFTLKKTALFLKSTFLKVWSSNYVRNSKKAKIGIIAFCVVMAIVGTVAARNFVLNIGSHNTVNQQQAYDSEDVSHGAKTMMEDIGRLFGFLGETASDWSDESRIVENCMRKYESCRDQAQTKNDLDACSANYEKCLP